MDREKILQLYANGLGSQQVAEITGCSYMTVIRLARKAGIVRRRGPSELSLRKRGNTCMPFRPEFISYLDGLLISDGSVTKPNGCSVCASYRQHCVHKRWLIAIRKHFSMQGLKSVIEYDNSIWSLRTLHYDQMAPIRKRWYRGIEKIIPRDIAITPAFMKNWVYGDGGLVCINKTTLKLATDSFSEDDVDWILDKVNKELNVGFRKNYHKESANGNPQFRLTLCVRDGLHELYRYMGECDVRCFKYKWPKYEK